MTYCVAVKTRAGLVFLSDSRTNAGLDQISTFRKMIVYEKAGDRFMTLFQRYKGALVWMSRASGLLLIGIGILMITGSMTVLSSWLQQWTPDALRDRI